MTHSALLAAACAQLQPRNILRLWYWVPERADELYEGLHKLFVPKLHHFAGEVLLRNANLAIEEGIMGNYSYNGHSEGSMLRRKRGRTTTKDSHQQ